MDQATAPSTHETGRGQHGSLSAAQVENYVLMAWGCYGAVKLDCRHRGRGREIMSAIGTKQTFQCALLMSAFGGKADIDWTCSDVAFDPKRTSTAYDFPAT